MIQQISNNVAASIKNRVPEHPASQAVLAYSLALMINTSAIILLTILGAFITGNIKSALVVLISFAILRQVSGGYHLKSGGLCIAVSVGILTVLSWVPNLSTVMNNSLTAAAFVLAAIFAPSRIERQTRIKPKYFPFLKLLACLIISINFIVGSSVLAATFLAQALTLIYVRGGEKHHG